MFRMHAAPTETSGYDDYAAEMWMDEDEPLLEAETGY